MGQYYHPTMIDEEGNINWINTHAYDNGLKLMEHSYVGNSVMNAVFSQIKDHPLRIAWIGDYSDEEQGDAYEHKLMRTAFMHIFDTVYGDEREEHLVQPDPMPFDLSSTGWYLVNHTQRQYISMDAYMSRNSWKERWEDWRTGETQEYEMCVNPLSLLTACGNDRGCGDYHANHPDYNKVGSWAFDRIELTQKKPIFFQEVMYTFTEQKEEAVA